MLKTKIKPWDAVKHLKTEKDMATYLEEDSQPIENLIKKLKSADPLIDTPLGALLAYKDSRGWTQQTLSKKSGIPQPDLSKILSGLRPIGPIIAKKLGKAFGVDYKNLL